LTGAAFVASAWRAARGRAAPTRRVTTELIWTAVPLALLVLLLTVVGPLHHG